MGCILLASKFFDVNPLPLSNLHEISGHIYNNAMINCTEMMLLKFLDFNLFIRDKLIVDRVGLLLESIRFLIDSKDFEEFKQ
jgi:hypothetical protein